MAEIKNSILFQKKKKNPLDKIKAQNEKNKQKALKEKEEKLKEEKQKEGQVQKEEKSKKETIEKAKEEKKSKKVSRAKKQVEISKKYSSRNNLGKGAPDKYLDKSLKAMKSVKISPLLDAILKELTDKYESTKIKDEILRAAMNEYICTHFEKEERRLLLSDIQKHLDKFWLQNPILPERNENGKIIQSAKEIQKETIHSLEEAWKL